MNRTARTGIGLTLCLALGVALVALSGCTTTKTDKPRNPHNDDAVIMKREPDKRFHSAPER